MRPVRQVTAGSRRQRLARPIKRRILKIGAEWMIQPSHDLQLIECVTECIVRFQIAGISTQAPKGVLHSKASLQAAGPV